MMQLLLQHMHLFAAGCSKPGFFGLPTWYEYLKTGVDKVTGHCEVNFAFPDDVPLIFLAVLDILLRVAGVVAIGYVIFGGIQYVTSQGEPDKTAKAQGTIINALIGMALAILSAAIVSFVGSRIGK